MKVTLKFFMKEKYYHSTQFLYFLIKSRALNCNYEDSLTHREYVPQNAETSSKSFIQLIKGNQCYSNFERTVSL